MTWFLFYLPQLHPLPSARLLHIQNLFKCKAIYKAGLDLCVDKVSDKHTASGHSAGLFGSGLKHFTTPSKQSTSSVTLSCFHTLIPSPDLL